MDLCVGDKIILCENDTEEFYKVEEISAEYVKLTNETASFLKRSYDLNGKALYLMNTKEKQEDQKENFSHMVLNSMHKVEQISYEKAVKIMEVLMDEEEE